VADTIISEVQVTLGNQVVVSDMHYPYTSHKNAILNYASDANKSHRTSNLYVKDSAGRMDAH
jgi:hypothetical protein